MKQQGMLWLGLYIYIYPSFSNNGIYIAGIIFLIDSWSTSFP